MFNNQFTYMDFIRLDFAALADCGRLQGFQFPVHYCSFADYHAVMRCVSTKTVF
jgi:hypothetical protein